MIDEKWIFTEKREGTNEEEIFEKYDLFFDGCNPMYRM